MPNWRQAVSIIPKVGPDTDNPRHIRSSVWIVADPPWLIAAVGGGRSHHQSRFDSLLKLADLDWTLPDHTTLCRRQKTLALQSPFWRADGPLNLLLDSTGIKFLGDGEWQACKHGVQGRRQWRKVHLAMDTATSDIRAVEFTPSSDGDSPVLPDLLDQIREGEEIGAATSDGAYDNRRCHTAIIHRQSIPIIPIRKNGRPWKEDCLAALARNETLRASWRYGRAFWKRWSSLLVLDVHAEQETSKVAPGRLKASALG